MDADQKDEVRELVRNVIREEFQLERQRSKDHITGLVVAAFKDFGMSAADEKEYKEYREDQRYLRRWRKGADKITGISLTAFVTFVVGGLASALILGIRALVIK